MTAFLWNWSNVNRLYNWHPVEKSRKKRAAHIWKQKKQNTFLTWTNVFTADEKLLLIGKWYAWVSFTLNLMTRFLFVTLKLSTLICTRHEKKDSNNSNNNKNHSNHAFVYTSHIWHKTIFFSTTYSNMSHSLVVTTESCKNVEHSTHIYTVYNVRTKCAHWWASSTHKRHSIWSHFECILHTHTWISLYAKWKQEKKHNKHK